VKLKTKFKIILVTVIGLALSVSLFVIIQVQELKKEIEENRAAGEIMKGAFELNLLTSDYLLHPEARTREQWQARHQSIEVFLQPDIFGHYFRKHLEEQTILDNLRKEHGAVQITYLKLAENLESQEISPELEERLVTELLIKSQSMLSNASRLMEVSRLELVATQQRTVLFVMISVAILAGGIMFALLVQARSILGPILSLQKGAEIIGSGNLKHRIDIKRKDEIGQLALSFNEMSKTLRKSYSSLEQKIEELKELDKLKDNFLNTTSHELKTPLIPIKSQLQLLLAEDYGKLNQEQRESLEMILRNEERLNKLVSDVLDISRIRSKKLKLTLEKFSPTEIIKQVVEEMKAGAQEKEIDLTTKLADLPKITADTARISQVVGNLVNNAIKFTPEKGKIEIETGKEKGKVVVKISDTGIGISPKNLKKLFTPFVQLDIGLARKHGGTGLGLVICKGIIEAHGGKIWAESPGEGKGATFAFALPIGKAKIK
jgi:signal transduction histidine kinase